MKIKFNIEIEVDQDGQYQLFGNPRFICPEHSINDHEIKTCFLDNLTASIEGYAHEDDERLTVAAQALKRAILDTVIIDRT